MRKSISTVTGAAIASIAMTATPVQARFLQTDPVGYKDQFNLYAYVNNDPINQIDPRGTDAIVLIHDEKNIQIILPMTFTGNSATPSNIAAAVGNIESAWTGTFDGINVSTTVVQGTSAFDPSVTNTMIITSGNTSKTGSDGSQGHSFVTNGVRGEVTTQDVSGVPIRQPNGTHTLGEKGGDTYAHEGGHYMGPDNSSTSGTLMGPGSGGRPTGDDIRAVMQENTPTRAINTVIRCADDDRC